MFLFFDISELGKVSYSLVIVYITQIFSGILLANVSIAIFFVTIFYRLHYITLYHYRFHFSSDFFKFDFLIFLSDLNSEFKSVSKIKPIVSDNRKPQ